MGRLEGICYVNPAQEVLDKYEISWDAASRIVEIGLAGVSAEHGYDNASQVVSATYKDGELPAERYEYDANGNRKNFAVSANNLLTGDGEFRYTYDGEGNRVAKISGKSRTEYFWDHRNRLVKAVCNGKKVEYGYDYRNRLTRRNEEIFLHDGWQVVLSLKNGKVADRYFWGSRQDELLCENDGFVLCDHLGGVRKVVGRDGKAVSSLKYSAFGESDLCT